MSQQQLANLRERGTGPPRLILRPLQNQTFVREDGRRRRPGPPDSTPSRTPEVLPSTGAIIWRRQRLIDASMVSRWIKLCETGTGHCCKPRMSVSDKASQILLIDCQEMCLVKEKISCRYIALSYVWGSIESVETTKARLVEFSQPNGLKMADMTRTVGDAILFVKQIGERYLWVDRLCIVQDDAAQKAKAISKMADIYLGATLVLVAAAGEDANAGLPGVESHPRTDISMEFMTGVPKLGDTNMFGESLAASIYETRGWT